MRLSSVIAPRDREFFDLFEEAGGNILRAAELLDRMLRDLPRHGGDLARDILICEQEGDRITHDIIRRLNETFVTPIDREDIYELASALDDIVDYTEEVADYLGLYKIEAPMEQSQRLAHVLLDCARQIARGDAAAARLQGHLHYTVEINRLENDGDRDHARGDRRAVRRRHRPDGRDPLEGHLRAARGGDRRDRARGEHPRGHRHQELASAARRPMDSDLILVIVVATALAFDFTNGFHDTANVVATSISTRAMAPRAGGRLRGDPQLRRARSSRSRWRPRSPTASSRPTSITPLIVFAGLIGAIAWNLITWYFGLPSSSSHALIGGVVGAAFVAEGADAVHRRRAGRQGDRAGAGRADRSRSWSAGLAILVAYRIVGRLRPGPGDPRLPARPGHLRRAARARARHQRRPEDDGRDHARADRQRHSRPTTSDVPTWVVVSSATAIALGTYMGGWRIIRTMGSRIIKMDTAQGFAAQGAGAAVILAASHFGFPLSTTHTISGGVMGAGAAKRLSAVRWGVAGNIVVAWVLTLPAAGAIGALHLRRHAHLRHGRRRAVDRRRCWPWPCIAVGVRAPAAAGARPITAAGRAWCRWPTGRGLGRAARGRLDLAARRGRGHGGLRARDPRGDPGDRPAPRRPRGRGAAPTAC